MAVLLDTNLQRAYNELGPSDGRPSNGDRPDGRAGSASERTLGDALALLAMLDSGGPDHIANILGWIDWDESKPWDSANHVGRGPSSGVGEMRSAIDAFTRQCNALSGVWEGAAADAFQEYSKNVLENCRRVTDRLEAMLKVMASGDGTTHEAMKDLTRKVWESAGDIADDKKIRAAVTTIVEGLRTIGDPDAEDVQKRKDAQLELMGGVDRLKKSVTREVERIDDDVLQLVMPFTEPVDLKNPLASRVGPPTHFKLDQKEAMRIVEQQMPSAIAGVKRAKHQMEHAWHAITDYDFGTSPNAQAVVTMWRKALTNRASELAECYGQSKGMYAGAMTVIYNSIVTDNWNQEQLDKGFSAEYARQRLHDYWHRNASRAVYSHAPNNGLPSYYEKEHVEPRLDALDEGWNGKGKPPAEVKDPEGEHAAEIGAEIGEKGIKGSSRGRGLGG
jgi:hypothetical protein